MRIGNDLIGKFKGIPVYKSNMVDYVNNRYYYDEENMYLINGELIYKNEIFAKYDGNYVSELDAHLRREFYTIPDNFKRAISNYNDRDTVNETENLFSTGNFEFKTVDEILDSSFGSFATEIDAFLKNALES